MIHVVKRKGHQQNFDERKLYASVFAACLSAHVDTEEAEHIAGLVTREVKRWITNKAEITSDQIFEEACKELGHLSKEASFMYETHRDIS